ncbi:MAG: (Fe-S)-binding protein [Promethearchaeota archaeon]
MGVFETLKKYKWMLPLINKADRDTKATLLKSFRNKRKDFYPAGEYKADIDNLIKCMLCPNMCRFDCGTLQASQTETMSPAYKSKIGYYLSIGKIDPSRGENNQFIDLMYKCTNEENCKVWCPFDFSVVSLLESVRDDLNDKGLMPDYCKAQVNKLEKTKTIEEYNIFETYQNKGIENVETKGDDEVFYYIGCEMMKFPNVVKANIGILKKLGIKFSTNLQKRVCCGSPLHNIRDLETARNFARENVDLIEKTGANLVVSDCPGCVIALSKKYEKIGIKLNTKVIHIVKFIDDLIEKKRLKPKNNLEIKKVTIHDPCLMARNLKDNNSIRNILKSIPDLEVMEAIYNREYTHCCGWSGTAHWADKNLAIKEASNRVNELKETEAKYFISACPLCELGLNYGLSESEKEIYKIMDISELLFKTL